MENRVPKLQKSLLLSATSACDVGWVLVPPQVEGQTKLEAECLSSLPDFWKFAPEKARRQGNVQMERCFFGQGDVRLTRWEACPCCYAHGKPAVFGNLLEQGLEDVWNYDYYRAARRLITHHWAEKIGLVRDNCRLFERWEWEV